jgi:hypothetical protein
LALHAARPRPPSISILNHGRGYLFSPGREPSARISASNAAPGMLAGIEDGCELRKCFGLCIQRQDFEVGNDFRHGQGYKRDELRLGLLDGNARNIHAEAKAGN